MIIINEHKKSPFNCGNFPLWYLERLFVIIVSELGNYISQTNRAKSVANVHGSSSEDEEQNDEKPGILGDYLDALQTARIKYK